MKQNTVNVSLSGLLFAVVFMSFMVAAAILASNHTSESLWAIALLLLIWLGLVILFLAVLKNRVWDARRTGGQAVNLKQTRLFNVLVLLFFWVGLIPVIALTLTSSTLSSAGRIWAVLLLVGFWLFILYGIVLQFAGPSIGRRMRAGQPVVSLSRSETSTVSSPAEETLVPPARAFAFQIFDMNSELSLSSEAASLANRGQTLLKQSLFIWRRSAFLFWACYLVLSPISWLLGTSSGLGLDVWFWLSIALLVAWPLANPNRYQTILTLIVWAILTFIWGGTVAFIGLNAIVLYLGQAQLSQPGPGTIVTPILVGVVLAICVWRIGLAFRENTRLVEKSKPLPLLLLWVFGPYRNISTLLNGIGLQWRSLGPIQFLKGGDIAIDAGQVASFLEGQSGKAVVQTPQELAERLAAFKYRPDWSGGYATNTLLCNDAVWKLALDAMLADASVVAMNLCGFSPTNQGCIYEIGLLLDRFATEGVLLIVDETTDQQFLLATLSQRWEKLASNSPNRAETAAPVRIYRLSSHTAGIFSLSATEASAGSETRGREIRQAATTVDQVRVAKLAYKAFSTAQSQVEREVECMFKLMCQGAVYKNLASI